MKRLLLLKTGAFGDIILTSVSIDIAAKFFHDYEIYFLTNNQYGDIYQECPLIKKILTFPIKMNLASFLRFVKEIRQEKFDVIVDLQGNLKTNFLTFLFGGEKRIGLYKRVEGKFFLTHSIKKKSNLNPILAQQILWKKITKKEITGKLQVWISDKRNENFNSFLQQYRLEQNKYVVFHPSASPEWRTKLWIKENWITLGKFFLEKKLKVVLVGDKNSTKISSEIAKTIGSEAIDLCGKTDFFTLALFIKNSKIFFTTDSGPLHIGAATKAETIAIFGPTNPELHCPPGVKYLKADVNCSPCYRKRCKQMSCMKAITPEKIKQLIKIEKENIKCII